MACGCRSSVISVAANNCCSRSLSFMINTHQLNRKIGRIHASKFRFRALSDESDDCNVEECAPDKEVGKISVEWLAGEKTKVVGTFPPRKRGWTGYVEKDTAGQTNIYSVEPTVYVAESAISSGNAGSSSDGAENTVAVAAGLALISVAAASFILLLVGKNPTQIQPIRYSGPSLSYYINKFQLPEINQASIPTQMDGSSTTEPPNSNLEVPQVPNELGSQLEPSTSNSGNAS